MTCKGKEQKTYRIKNLVTHKGRGANFPSADLCRAQIAQLSERVTDVATLRRCWRILAAAYNKQ